MTDQNAGGGILQTIPQAFVTVDGLRVAVIGSQGSAHPPCPEDDSHCANVWATAGGSPSVRINGLAVIRAGDVDSCSHARVAGSPTVRVG